MLEMIFSMTFFAVVGLVVLAGFLIWKFHDVIAHLLEIMIYALRCAGVVAMQFAVELLGAVEDFLGDVEITDTPWLRLCVMGAFGLLPGVGLILLLSMTLNQPWVLITLAAAVGICMGIGLLADPERDWDLPVFPSFTKGGGPKLPLNL